MSSPFVAEIRIFAGNFAPTGWATCDGQIMSISQNTALFSLLGTTYGGNGQSTFALPNLQGSAPMHAGQGQGGLSQRFLGEQSGEQAVTLLVTEMPAHSHGAQATSGSNQDTPAANAWSTIGTTRTPPALYNSAQNVQMSPFALAITGASSPHNNMSPYQCLTFIIALQGVFPARN
jgi:microcystin-dependent protein